MDYWNQRRVFVTGAAGIIGSWLTELLVKKNADVVVLIRDKVPKSQLFLSGTIDKVTIVNGGLEDYQVVERILNEYEIDTCFHLGAQTIVGTANRSPLSTFESNIKGTWNLLEAARHSKLLKGMVVASTDKAYGTHEKLPYTEEATLKALHPYDVSKACIDMLSRTYHNTYELPVVVTRCGNVYGGGDLNFNRIIPGTIRSIYFNEAPIIRSDGTFLRDYNYVLDVANAYMMIAEKMHKRKLQGEAFNLSTNSPLTVLEIVKKISKLMNSSIEPKILNEAKGEIKDQYLSAEKANKILGWKPTYSLEKGLKETIEWYKTFFSKHY